MLNLGELPGGGHFFPRVSDGQARMLKEIYRFLRKTQTYPTFRELSALLGLRSTHRVAENYKMLKIRGYMERHPLGWIFTDLGFSWLAENGEIEKSPEQIELKLPAAAPALGRTATKQLVRKKVTKGKATKKS